MGFWDKFSDLMESLPAHIENEIDLAEKSGNYTQKTVIQKSSSSSSTSTIVQGGNKIVVKTVNGKTKITVNGKEYTEKQDAKT